MSDIVTRLRAWRELHLTRLGTLFDAAADAIESLRREAREQRLEIAGLREERRMLLEADRPRTDKPEAIAGCDTPAWLSRPHYVDPPSGWRYGFPKLYDPGKDGDLARWLVVSGYPEHLAIQGLPCTFTEVT